ncbi:MAG: DEAD/DEAH box helicase [bacterium]|nr:DEAD/DEAH box helicase [bacterium]
MNFDKLLYKYRQISISQRDKGDRFERLMQAYLLTDPKYAYRFKKVWLWEEFPGRDDLGGGDTGIDLVALTNDGDYWAVQCKCYHEGATIDKPAVNSFLATSSRKFNDENLQPTGFVQRLWISTTNKWGPNATEAIKNQTPPVARLNLHDLQEAPVDWEKLEKGIHGEASRAPKKKLRPHQKEAMDKAHHYFRTHDRGKLIMACGTGKTFNSLRIAEKETGGKGLILFLVPSIALLGQSLREWSADAKEPINAICICSDPRISKKRSKKFESDTISVVDLALPASTDSTKVLEQFQKIEKDNLSGMTVVFSTYQSIDVISNSQDALMKNGFKEFDLIICDEAHRTTGVTLANENESAFVKVHDNDFIKAKKRMYMTATPRLYSDDSKSKAAQSDAFLCSMDDADLYGDEIYRIGFGEAVEKDLLSDYKVLILTLNDNDVPPAVQNMIANEGGDINIDDASKLIGCINALSKQFLGDAGKTKESDPELMRRAVAFCQNIKVSKKIRNILNKLTNTYIAALPIEKRQQMVAVEAKHMDGTMSAPVRDDMLGWVKSSTEYNQCRLLTNVRVLSEGVDVPSLDAVLFLSAKNSQVDVVQSVGRVMRKSPGKRYGYIIIPVVVPADVEASIALADNDRYKVVWTVLNALRAHDDRFNATVNKIELNKKKPGQIIVGRPETNFDASGNPVYADGDNDMENATQLSLKFNELQSAIYARMVLKVGDRRYWEQWAKDVATIADRHIERIKFLIASNKDKRASFDNFITGLKANINPGINEMQAIEMLAQHIITKPIFEALFEDYSFVKNNAVSTSMQAILNALENETMAEESNALKRFYKSVEDRAKHIDNAEGKQRIVIELYDKFFKTAFPKMVEQLGIAYTPVEIVDFIVRSVNDVLKMEFNRSITDENINVIDPFTGTGTFITRLLQSGLIDKKDLYRKYQHELHANEIVLLAYYIAAVNIENAYHDQLSENRQFEPFGGIVLTDTFQLGEDEDNKMLYSEMFPQNSARVVRQKSTPLCVIMGNPPYSAGQKSANDNAQNQKYDILDARIADTYVKASTAALQTSLYDSYIRAFRWSTDRLDSKHGGVIAFVSNGSWLDGNSANGFRNVLEKEFSSIWVFNLRGNQRTSGEVSRKEGGKIFGSGSRATIAITILVKKPDWEENVATIDYSDIGDYLKRDEKLEIIRKFSSIANPKMDWQILKPNLHDDWINLRNEKFYNFIQIGNKRAKNSQATFFEPFYSNGLKTQRDAWCYNSSEEKLKKNIREHLDFYNNQRIAFIDGAKKNPKLDVKSFLTRDVKRISWTVALEQDVAKNKEHKLEHGEFVTAYYRPFFKQHLYFSRALNERVLQIPKLFPIPSLKNLVICVSGVGVTKDFSTIISDTLPDLEIIGKSQCFPLYYYEKQDIKQMGLFGGDGEGEYIRRDGVTDFILTRANSQYGKNVGKEDIFYYVYGILHSPDYCSTFSSDLKKMLPRIPLIDDVRDFWKFSKAGRQLAELHINYEAVPPYKDVAVTGADSGFYMVDKMRFPKKGQLDTINYNSRITISNIPEQAYRYVINGKSAIHWIMDRYKVKIDKDSGIKNDPNDWAIEVNNPRYILDLLLSIINVSMQTVEIVAGLPQMKFD